MGKRTVNQILEDFKDTFLLKDEELNKITKPWSDNPEKLEKIARRMDAIRKEALEIMDNSRILRIVLFVHNNDLKTSYFNLMVEGWFDKVIEDLIKFRKSTKLLEEIVESLKKRGKIKG